MNLNNLLEIAAFSPRLLLFPNAEVRCLPFAAWIIKEVQPTLFVELGSHISDFYFATCQSISEAGLPTKCITIISLIGDTNSLNFDEINANAKAHNQAHYVGFSQILQSGFDKALSSFSDGSIGLLHLNNLKTHNSIIHTLESWLPKLTTDAIVMITGISVHEANPKGNNVWDVLQIRYSSNILFPLDNGLAIFHVNDSNNAKLISWLQSNSEEKQKFIKYFESLGSRLHELNELDLLKNQIIERDKQIVRLSQIVTERDFAIAERDQAVAGNDGQILALKQIIAKLSIEITRIIQSKSWKVTKPLRSFRRKLDNQQKNYSDDHNLTSLLKSEIVQNAGLPMVSGQNQDYVPLLKSNLQNNNTVRVIVFHHQQNPLLLENHNSLIDENNIQFKTRITETEPDGQFQSRHASLPKANGWREKIKLAKLYGIEGICFYCYCPGNNQYLDMELNNYLKDSNLDLPFCSCWAYESLEQQTNNGESSVLNSQALPNNKDIAFIQHVSASFSDPRHIRIGDKPLLLISIPDVMPSMTGIVNNWRNWCRDKGHGELYLVGTGCLDSLGHTHYGFDAAIESPQICLPISRVTNINQSQPNNNKIHNDLSEGQERSCDYDKPSNKLFRTVCPIANGNTIDSDKTLPVAYQEWLFNAINDTSCRFANRDERILLVNPRNKHSDINFLDSDPHYGFAYLEATRMALVRSAAIKSPSGPDNKQTIAVVIHAYYETILDEILGYIDAINEVPLKLYVTTSIDLFETVQGKLKRRRHGFYLLPVSNRGRDMLPFLKILPEVLAGGHDQLIKVHTKKSIHREDGDVWRKDVFDKVLSEQSVKANIDYLANNPDVGILGPNDHIVPMDSYAGANTVRVAQLAARLGIANNVVPQLNFVAGSMFIARTKAILPLMTIALSEIDFEAEAGQLDGTLAHALERIFPVSAFSVGLRTCSPDNSVTENYQFTNKTLELKGQDPNLAKTN